MRRQQQQYPANNILVKATRKMSVTGGNMASGVKERKKSFVQLSSSFVELALHSVRSFSNNNNAHRNNKRNEEEDNECKQEEEENNYDPYSHHWNNTYARPAYMIEEEEEDDDDEYFDEDKDMEEKEDEEEMMMYRQEYCNSILSASSFASYAQQLEQYAFVIIGFGVAGAYAAKQLADLGVPSNQVCIIGEEPVHGYERPALSKGYLFPKNNAASIPPARLPNFHCGIGQLGSQAISGQDEQWYQARNWPCYLGVKVDNVDPYRKIIHLPGGSFDICYEKLIVCTGSRPLSLDCPGNDLNNVFYLRNEQDAGKLVKKLEAPGHAIGHGANRVVVVGGGTLGVEVAAALAGWGYEEICVVFHGKRLLDRMRWANEFQEKLQEQILQRAPNIKLYPNQQVQKLMPISETYKQDVGRVVLDSGVILESQIVICCLGAVPSSPEKELFYNASMLNSNTITTSHGGTLKKSSQHQSSTNTETNGGAGGSIKNNGTLRRKPHPSNMVSSSSARYSSKKGHKSSHYSSKSMNRCIRLNLKTLKAAPDVWFAGECAVPECGVEMSREQGKFVAKQAHFEWKQQEDAPFSSTTTTTTSSSSSSSVSTGHRNVKRGTMKKSDMYFNYRHPFHYSRLFEYTKDPLIWYQIGSLHDYARYEYVDSFHQTITIGNGEVSSSSTSTSSTMSHNPREKPSKCPNPFTIVYLDEYNIVKAVVIAGSTPHLGFMNKMRTAVEKGNIPLSLLKSEFFFNHHQSSS